MNSSTATLITPSSLFSNIWYASGMSASLYRCVIRGWCQSYPAQLDAESPRNRRPHGPF